MKYLLVILSLLTFQFIFGQHSIGLNVAPGIQTSTYDSGLPYESTFSLRSGMHYGYRFNEEKPWGFQTGLYYNQRGYMLTDLTLEHSSNEIVKGDVIVRRNNIGVNFLIKAERRFLYASFGPCLENNLNNTFIINYENENLGQTKTSSSANDFSDSFYFGYEVNAGVQFSLTEKTQCFAELSMNQVFSQKSEIIGDRVAYFNMNLGLGINYCF